MLKTISADYTFTLMTLNFSSSSQDDHSESWDVLRHEAGQQEAYRCQEAGGAHVV